MGDAAEQLAEAMLVVEDCPRLAPLLCRELSSLAHRVEVARDVKSTVALLQTLRPEVIVLDVCLPDGSAADVLQAIRQLDTSPAVVVLTATKDPVKAFQLAEGGARAFLSKPVSRTELRNAISDALRTPPDVTPHLRGCVGHVPVRDLESHVRSVMVSEALARSSGNRRGAARLLSISRELLRHVLRGMQ